MAFHFFIAGATFACLFILFLVISKTMNNMINQLTKLEYLIQKEFEFRKETAEIHEMLEEKMAKADAREPKAVAADQKPAKAVEAKAGTPPAKK
jgi:hypothetical protein